jgi:hypothetical protein
MPSNRPTVRQVQDALRQLNQAQESLAQFLDPGDENCHVRPSARTESGAYLSSWVGSPLDLAVKRLECALEGRPYRAWDESESV